MNEEKFKQATMKIMNQDPDCWLKKYSSSIIAGMPDLIGGIKGKFIGIEVKVFEQPKRSTTEIRPFKNLTAIQTTTLCKINDKGSVGIALSAQLKEGKLAKMYAIELFSQDIIVQQLLWAVKDGVITDSEIFPEEKVFDINGQMVIPVFVIHTFKELKEFIINITNNKRSIR